MNKIWKYIIGAFTLWIMIYPVFFLVVLLGSFDSPIFTPLTNTSLYQTYGILGLLIPIHLLSAPIGLAMMIFYIVHIIRNQAASQTIRIIMILIILLAPFIGMPLYYYAFIWLPTPPEWAAGT